ncbi:hypothetical protein FSP39_016230 [Pinctada imbricata]|uniref:Cadherin domain-containing protein n=1 Tax=Pinctada imbricata TaxID=66713 RepID=A0AA88Y0T3_PINIB|nr:hypothetical protein FSP39_016230 [Pinctada imbricata]
MDPVATNLREDNIAELFLSHVTPSAVSAGDTISCGVTASPASSDFFTKTNSSTGNPAVYCRASPTGLNYVSVQTYTLTVTCNENIVTSNTATSSLSINIVQNSAPSITNLPASTSISSTTTTSGTFVFNVTATDPEGDQLYFGMTCNPTGCPFQIQESGQILATADLRGTTQTGYDISVSINDSRSTVGPSILTVTITDINSAPTFSNPLVTAIVINENSAFSTSLYDLNVNDANVGDTHTFTATYTPTDGVNYFIIDSSNGIISTSSTNNINYETLKAANAETTVMTVTVSDGQETATTSVSITVADINEAPAFSKSNYLLSADEANSGTAIGNPNFGVVDPDTGDTLSYALGCSDFSYNSATEIVSYAINYDVDTAGHATSQTCVVTVNDGSLTSTATLTINVININDNTPVLDAASYTYIVDSSTAVGATIGTVTATDADASPYGTVTYTIDQTSLGNQYFTISSSGAITTATSLSSFAAGQSLSLTVSATDSGGLSATSPITIVIPATTTAGSTSSTERTLSFFDDSRNIAWFTAAMVLAVVVVAIATYICLKKFRYKNMKK